MRLLLDENLPRRLKQDLSDHEIYTANERDWTGISNGKLLELLIEHKFDALLTFDKNLQYQQNFSRYTVAVIVLDATDNRYLAVKATMKLRSSFGQRSVNHREIGFFPEKYRIYRANTANLRGSYSKLQLMESSHTKPKFFQLFLIPQIGCGVPAYICLISTKHN